MGKKFLHIMQVNNSRTSNTIEMIRKIFEPADHTILIWATKDEAIKYNPILLSFLDLEYMPNSIARKYTGGFIKGMYLRSMMDKADCIIWHSLEQLKGKFAVLFASKRKYLKKTIWIENYFDIYSWKRPNKKWKDKFYNFLMKKLRTEIKAIGFTIPANRMEYERQFPHSKVSMMLNMPAPFSKEVVDALENNSHITEKRKIPIVLMGYTGHPLNRHINIIDRLSLLDSKNFKVIIPMNYALPMEYGSSGTFQYRRRVIEYTERVLGIRATKLCKWGVPAEQYFKVINSIDVAIFNCSRLANRNLLFYLLYLNKKVFLSPEDDLYVFLKEKGIPICDINEVETLTYEEFIEQPASENINQYLKDFFDIKKTYYAWQEAIKNLSE